MKLFLKGLNGGAKFLVSGIENPSASKHRVRSHKPSPQTQDRAPVTKSRQPASSLWFKYEEIQFAGMLEVAGSNFGIVAVSPKQICPTWTFNCTPRILI